MLKKFNQQNKVRLLLDEWYLVQCNKNYCESGFEIAKWDGLEFVSQSNNTVMTVYVEGFMLTDRISTVS